MQNNSFNDRRKLYEVSKWPSVDMTFSVSFDLTRFSFHLHPLLYTIWYIISCMILWRVSYVVHTGNLISISFTSTGIYSNIFHVMKAIVTSLTDKNSNKGKTKCRSKYWPIRVVKSNSAILPERKIKEKKIRWIQMFRIRMYVFI